MHLSEIRIKRLRELLASAEQTMGTDSASARMFRQELERRAQADGRRTSGRTRRVTATLKSAVTEPRPNPSETIATIEKRRSRASLRRA